MGEASNAEDDVRLLEMNFVRHIVIRVGFPQGREQTPDPTRVERFAAPVDDVQGEAERILSCGSFAIVELEQVHADQDQVHIQRRRRKPSVNP